VSLAWSVNRCLERVFSLHVNKKLGVFLRVDAESNTFFAFGLSLSLSTFMENYSYYKYTCTPSTVIQKMDFNTEFSQNGSIKLL